MTIKSLIAVVTLIQVLLKHHSWRKWFLHSCFCLFWCSRQSAPDESFGPSCDYQQLAEGRTTKGTAWEMLKMQFPQMWEVAAEVFRISLQYQKLHSLQLSNLHLEDVGHLLWTRGPRDEYEVVRWRRKLWKCSDRLKFAFENLSSFSFYYIHNPLLKIREFPGPGGRSVTTQWGKPKGIWMDLAHRLGGHACLIIYLQLTSWMERHAENCRWYPCCCTAFLFQISPVWCSRSRKQFIVFSHFWVKPAAVPCANRLLIRD